MSPLWPPWWRREECAPDLASPVVPRSDLAARHGGGGDMSWEGARHRASSGGEGEGGLERRGRVREGQRWGLVLMRRGRGRSRSERKGGRCWAHEEREREVSKGEKGRGGVGARCVDGEGRERCCSVSDKDSRVNPNSLIFIL